MINFLKKLFEKKTVVDTKEVAAANALAMHIINAEKGSTAAFKRTRT